MKKYLRVFILVFTSILFCSSCVTYGVGEATVQLPKEPIKSIDTIFYMRTEELDLSIVNAITESLTENGLTEKVIYSIDDIPDLSTKLRSGTCFSILPSMIVTNAHVFEYKDQYLSVNNKLYPVVKIIEDVDKDLAIAEIIDYEFPYSFELGIDSDYILGKDVYAIGYPITDLLGKDVRITKGIINSKSGFMGDTNEIQISAQIQPGNSGGPLLYDKDFGKVIGVVSSKINDLASLQQKGSIMQNVNFAIKIKNIEELFSGINDNILATKVKTPNTLEEASLATGLVYSTETPPSKYNKRLLIILSLNSTKNITYSQYGTIINYSILVNLRLQDVDNEKLYNSYYIQTYRSLTGNKAEVSKLAMDEFLLKLKETGYLINDVSSKELDNFL